MSKNINVNPGQYKVGGRERQGEDVVHGDERRRLGETEAQERQQAARARARRGRRRTRTPARG